ncbi:MAG: sensor histidine kinase [Bacteroidales bacterium]|nr:sensor histidine kinase [Bacteroidales bacterium]
MKNNLTILKEKTGLPLNEAQEMERSRIAADLHDGLGQKLSAISYLIQNIAQQNAQVEKINELQELIDETIDESRNISHSLMPGVLKDFGLIAALREMIKNNNKIKGTKLLFNHYGSNKKIPPELEKALFRICQEALSNILKHSNAENATFQLFMTEDYITLTIEDDGIGFNPGTLNSQENNGIGILSIKERVNSFDGLLTINSNPRKGTEIIIEIPNSVA